MENKREIFADGVGQIYFVGGMVRFDLKSLQPTEDGKTPTHETTSRIIMPPQGLLPFYNAMQQFIDKLVEAGIVKKAEPEK